MDMMNKPQLATKLHGFYRSVKKNNGYIGTYVRMLELAYSNACNFKCQHCLTRAPWGENAERLMPIDMVARLADEAHKIGVVEWDMYGGEPLLDKARLLKLIAAIKPERFSVFVTSNGWLMTPDFAKQLAAAGVNRVNISLDSFDAAVHDDFRGVKGAYSRALKALEDVKQAGLDAFVNITVGHFNAFSDDVENICQFAFERGYRVQINIAIPCGNWQGHLDVIVDERDQERMQELREKYGNIIRDKWNIFDKSNKASFGCQAMNKLYVTPAGDVFPCSFIHIKVGNLYEQSLKEIVEYGFSIKYFRNPCDNCLAGETPEFIKKFMVDKPMSVMKPLDAHEVFGAEDYV